MGEFRNEYTCDSVNSHQNARKNITFNFSEIHPDEVVHQVANLNVSKVTGAGNS